jgi:hypothetical protein
VDRWASCPASGGIAGNQGGPALQIIGAAIGTLGIWMLVMPLFFAPRLARAQHVEADARNDRCQPRIEVLDATSIGAA